MYVFDVCDTNLDIQRNTKQIFETIFTVFQCVEGHQTLNNDKNGVEIEVLRRELINSCGKHIEFFSSKDHRNVLGNFLLFHNHAILQFVISLLIILNINQFFPIG